MTYSTDELRWVALKLKQGFVLVMKDIFVSPNCLKPVLAAVLIKSIALKCFCIIPIKFLHHWVAKKHHMPFA